MRSFHSTKCLQEGVYVGCLSDERENRRVLKTSTSVQEFTALQRVGALPGVVPAQVVMVQDTGLCLLMDEFECLLNRCMDRGMEWQDHERLRIGRQLVHTLQAVHASGVFHCDVKPGNILMDSKEQPLLIDFGVAVRKEDKPSGSFEGTRMFCECTTPSAKRDFQSLCLSLVWMVSPWTSEFDRPQWKSVLADPVAAEIWSSRGQLQSPSKTEHVTLSDSFTRSFWY